MRHVLGPAFGPDGLQLHETMQTTSYINLADNIVGIGKTFADKHQVVTSAFDDCLSLRTILPASIIEQRHRYNDQNNFGSSGRSRLIFGAAKAMKWPLSIANIIKFFEYHSRFAQTRINIL